MKITKEQIEKMMTSTHAHCLNDGRGLVLERRETGQPAWRFRYSYAGQEKRLSLGTYPLVSLELAREKRDDMKRLLVEGINPSTVRKERKRADKAKEKVDLELMSRAFKPQVELLSFVTSSLKRVKARRIEGYHIQVYDENKKAYVDKGMIETSSIDCEQIWKDFLTAFQL